MNYGELVAAVGLCSVFYVIDYNIECSYGDMEVRYVLCNKYRDEGIAVLCVHTHDVYDVTMARYTI